MGTDVARIAWDDDRLSGRCQGAVPVQYTPSGPINTKSTSVHGLSLQPATPRE
jgi:hypothetical protein